LSQTNWKDKAELVGLAAIIASLFLVAYELRQNTTASRQAAAVTYATASRDIDLFVAGNPEFSSLLKRVIYEQEVSPDEWFRLSMFYRSVLRSWQDTHYQYLAGTLDEEIWNAEHRFMREILEADPGFSRFWANGNNVWFTNDFQTLIEQMLDDINAN
jgi:hypothetical protein